MAKKTSKDLAAKVATSDSDFRMFLQDEFLRRCRKNARYSIRAFASALALDHSTLSQMMRGRRKITKATIIKIAPHLGVGTADVDRFLRKLNAEEIQSAEYHQLTLDAFQIISDWYHYAIFELVTVNDFQADHVWVARKLRIRPEEASAAIDRLMRVGLIEAQGKGWKQKSSLISTVSNSFTTTAFRNLQRGVLEQALVALEETPFERRDQTSMTMAIDSSMLPEAKRRIKNFRRSLCRFMQKTPRRDSVYQLGVSFYPLTAPTNTERGNTHAST